MKAIIIAAGMGSRLDSLTDDKPKCMLEFKAKTLLRHQVDALRGAGIDRIVVIKGYKKEENANLNFSGWIGHSLAKGSQ